MDTKFVDVTEALRKTFTPYYISALISTIFMTLSEPFRDLRITDQVALIAVILVVHIGLNMLVFSAKYKKVRRDRTDSEIIRTDVSIPEWFWKTN